MTIHDGRNYTLEDAGGRLVLTRKDDGTTDAYHTARGARKAATAMRLHAMHPTSRHALDNAAEWQTMAPLFDRWAAEQEGRPDGRV